MWPTTAQQAMEQLRGDPSWRQLWIDDGKLYGESVDGGQCCLWQEDEQPRDIIADY